MNYEDDLSIDESALDVEWLEQPQLMFKYARYCAELEKVADEAKDKLEYVKAEVERDIRESPEKYGIVKITEAVVAGTILLQEKYKGALVEYNKAKFDAKVSGGAVRSFDQRKTALENLVRLNGQQYFAGPTVPRNLHEEYEAKKVKREQIKRTVSAGIAGRIQRQRTTENE
jgi:hypothetical protein